MSDDEYQGTGDPMVEIPFGDGCTLVIEDDGHPDPDVTLYVTDGNDSRDSYSLALSRERRNMGDAAFVDSFNVANIDDGGDDTDWGGDPSYKCDGCNRTWPRGTNQTPDADEDTCPECADGGGD